MPRECVKCDFICSRSPEYRYVDLLPLCMGHQSSLERLVYTWPQVQYYWAGLCHATFICNSIGGLTLLNPDNQLGKNEHASDCREVKPKKKERKIMMTTLHWHRPQSAFEARPRVILCGYTDAAINGIRTRKCKLFEASRDR